MCIANEHWHDCVVCGRTAAGVVTIARYCRKKEQVAKMSGRFVFPGTDDVIAYPDDGDRILYYEGDGLISDAVDDSSDEESDSDGIISHRYFSVEPVHAGIGYCQRCGKNKRSREKGVAKNLTYRLDRAYGDDLETAYDKNQAWLKELATSKQVEVKADAVKADAAEEVKVDVEVEPKALDGERHYHVPGAFDPAPSPDSDRCLIL